MQNTGVGQDIPKRWTRIVCSDPFSDLIYQRYIIVCIYLFVIYKILLISLDMVSRLEYVLKLII